MTNIVWHPWKVENSLNIIVNTPSVVSTVANYRDFFFRGSDNLLHHENFSLTTNGKWTFIKEEILGVEKHIKGTPVAVTGGPNSIDVFARGSGGSDEDRLIHICRTGAAWQPWDNLLDKNGNRPDVILSESPAAAASTGRLDVFVRSGADNHMSALHWKDGEDGWSGLTNLGGKLMSAPTATSNGATLLDVFAILNDGHINHISSADGKTWSGWDDLEGIGKAASFNEAPIAVSTTGRLDVFARNANNNLLWHAQWQKGVTPGWRVADADLGGPLQSAPSAFASASDHIDCFARIDNTFKYRYWGS